MKRLLLALGLLWASSSALAAWTDYVKIDVVRGLPDHVLGYCDYTNKGLQLNINEAVPPDSRPQVAEMLLRQCGRADRKQYPVPLYKT